MSEKEQSSLVLRAHGREKKRRRGRVKAKKPLTYVAYIKSKAWKLRKARYFDLHKKACAACQSRSRVLLHHISYARIGRERDEDFVPLCWSCHSELHETHGRARDMKGKLVALTNSFIDERRQEEEIAALLSYLT